MQNQQEEVEKDGPMSSSENEDVVENYYDDDDENDDDWESEEEEDIPAISLIGRQHCKNIQQALETDKNEHGFDLIQFCGQRDFDIYQCFRLINYFRSNDVPKNIDSISKDDAFLQDDKFLIPVNENDPYLQLDFEDLIEERLINNDTDVNNKQSNQNANQLAREVKSLKHDLEKITYAFKELQTHLFSDREPYSSSPKSAVKESKKSRDDDTHYFDSYSYNDIHQLMLQDRVRTESYRDYMFSNKDLFNDAIVLDVGCGTGILSMFAARAGAKHVYAVDASAIAYRAEMNIKENNLHDKITVIKGKIEEIEIPVDKVDIIISEWMGYFLLYESMMDSVLFARDKYLASSTGIMAPSKCTIMLGGFSDASFMNEHVNFWNDVYGFKMSAMSKDIYREALTKCLNEEGMITESSVLQEFDTKTCTVRSVDFSTPFQLNVTTSYPKQLHALVGYFDTFFESKDKSSNVGFFSTGPHATQTHWKQTIFMLDPSLSSSTMTTPSSTVPTVHNGDVIKGSFSCKKSPDNSRELIVEVVFDILREGIKVLGKNPWIQVWSVR